jgi:hypothetical protein
MGRGKTTGAGYVVGLALDDEDKATLEQVVAQEKLTRSDVLRRALRWYAKWLARPRPPLSSIMPDGHDVAPPED